MKKLTSFVLSLLLCLSLLPGQALAIGLPTPVDLSAQVEPLDLESPGEPESSAMPASAEQFPLEESEGQPKS